MTSYICPRCNYTTNRKSNFKHHITRKNICNPINIDTPIKSIAKTYGIDISPTENEMVSQNVSQTKYQSHSLSESQSITNCKYCNKPFTSANNCYGHQKHYCKYKKKEITITQDEIQKIKQDADKKAELNKNEKVELKMREAELKIKEAELKIKEVEGQIEVLADKKAQKMVLSLVDKLVPNQTTNNNSHNTNTQNNLSLIHI